MSARLDFIIDSNSPRQDQLISSYTAPGTSIIVDLVRNDKQIAYSVQPVTVNPPGSDTLYTADYETTDTFKVALGDIDEPPEGGVFSVLVGAQPDSAIPYNISAASLTTLFNSNLTVEGKPLCLVTLIEDGVYEIDAVSNGAIPTGFFAVTQDALLQPDCNANFVEQRLGSGSTRYQLFLVMKQAPVAYNEPTTALDAADVTISLVQAGSATANKIQKISFPTTQTYGGTFSISGTANSVDASAGVGKPLMSATQLAEVLTTHPEIHFNNPDATILDNITVTKTGSDFIVEFINDLGNDDSNELSVANIDLVAPLGRAGALSLNTISLYRLSLLSPGSDSFTLKFEIERTRISGEVKTLLLVNMTIKKKIINPSTMVPVPLPSYYTASETDALFARLDKIAPTYTVLTPGSMVTITCDSGKVVQNSIVELDQNTTLAISGAVNGQTGVLIVDQDGTGGWTLTLPGSSLVMNGGAGAVTLTGTASSRDILCWAYDGTSYNWTTGLNFT